MSKPLVEDESEVFEITDFTTASDWERFIARIEELIHEWKLNTTDNQNKVKGSSTEGVWEEKVASIPFADFNFTFTRHLLVYPESKGRKPSDGKTHDGKFESAPQAPPTATGDVRAPRGPGFSSTKVFPTSTVAGEEESQAGTPVLWEDMMSSDDVFPSRAHCLCRWYGLRDFVVLATAPGMEDVTSESRVAMLLSSLTIAANNTSCQVPLFVQAHARWRRLFYGTSEFPGFRTSFEMVQISRTPQQFNHLSGLIDVFKSKITIPVTSVPPVSVAVRMTYLLQDWAQCAWPQPPPDFDAGGVGEVGVKDLGDLPFGAYDDPAKELLLSTTWTNLSEEMIVDNGVYSDLDPLQAPYWSVRVSMNDQPQCLLGEYLMEFMKVCSSKESTQQLLGRFLELADNDVDMAQALQRLTDPGAYAIPSIGRVVQRATSKLAIRPEDAPIPANKLNEILLFLFPDARSDYDASKSKSVSQSQEGMHKSDSCASNVAPPAEGDNQKDMYRQLKSAPLDSLTTRLSVCMCMVHRGVGGLRAIAHLWQEFVMEMRYRWENNFVIPDLESGSPNMGCSLLHQKLQMLNACIERKKARERLTSGSTDSQDGATKQSASGPAHDDEEEEDDETFFECDDDVTDGPDGATLKHSPSGSSVASSSVGGATAEFKDTFTHKAEGRLKRHEDGLMLLNVPDEPLYVPLTQEPAPMTEDSLEEHAEVLAKLGTSAEGAHLRARMQSACLLSDMESFKAANPGCSLGDFVRWYSPRDWVEEEVMDEMGNIAMTGELSQRMQIPGNMWQEVWQTARPIPARKQRRLFDDTKEAEKVLHWLAGMKPADIVIKLMPMLCHSAISKLMEHEECKLPLLQKLMSQIVTKATKAMRRSSDEAKHYEDLVRHISIAEVIITRSRSLLNKFTQQSDDVKISSDEIRQFVNDVLEKPEVDIPGAARSPIGVIIRRLLNNAQKLSKLPTDDDITFSTSSDDDVMSWSDSTTGSSTNQSTGGRSSEFPRPIGKEFILRMFVQRPVPWSRPCPQRMYCVLMKDDFRLAGAFTSDTTFQ